MWRNFFLLCLVISCKPVLTNATTIDVLTLSQLPKPTYFSHTLPRATEVNIDAVDTLSQFLQFAKASTEGLSQHATKTVFRRLLVKFQLPLQKSIAGLSLAKTLGVTQIPAIVFNHRYIVYGTLDVLRALNAYQTYRLEKKHA